MVGTGSSQNIRESSVLKEVCQKLRRTQAMNDELKSVLQGTFQKRFQQALALVEQGKVRQFKFEPSGRTVWVVNGRKGDYQVVPDSMFCTCDDYYFRVIGHKRQLCYHLIAQFLAEAMGRFGRFSSGDGDYANFTAKWKPFSNSEQI